MRFWTEISGIRNLTKEINIRITSKSFPKEDTKWRTINPQHAGLESYMQARHDGFKPSPQNLV